MVSDVVVVVVVSSSASMSPFFPVARPDLFSLSEQFLSDMRKQFFFPQGFLFYFLDLFSFFLVFDIVVLVYSSLLAAVGCRSLDREYVGLCSLALLCFTLLACWLCLSGVRTRWGCVRWVHAGS